MKVMKTMKSMKAARTSSTTMKSMKAMTAKKKPAKATKHAKKKPAKATNQSPTNQKKRKGGNTKRTDVQFVQLMYEYVDEVQWNLQFEASTPDFVAWLRDQ